MLAPGVYHNNNEILRYPGQVSGDNNKTEKNVPTYR